MHFGISRKLRDPSFKVIVVEPKTADTILGKFAHPLVGLSGLANEAGDLGYPDLGFTTATGMVQRAAPFADQPNDTVNPGVRRQACLVGTRSSASNQKPPTPRTTSIPPPVKELGKRLIPQRWRH